MRLRRLDLDFFGHFTGRSFDFGPRPVKGSDFHIVYGPNEAGKTTTMEGYLRLLYGFKSKNEEYGFLHDRKTLQVSGIIDMQGVERTYTRFANKLVDETGATVPQTALESALAGLSQEQYRKLLCLDDETIEKGGEEIVSSKGEIGRLLFAASAGISDLSEMLAGVNDEVRNLYVKKGSKTLFSVLKKQLDEINARIKETDISAAAWRGLRETLTTAQADDEAAKANVHGLHRTAKKLEAMAEVLPLLDTVEALRARLASYDHYPARLDIDPETLVALLAEQSRHQADRVRLMGECDALRATIDGIVRDPDQVTLAVALTDIETLRSEYQAAEIHLPSRRQSLDEAMAQMQRCARDLEVGQGADLSALALSPAQIGQLDTARSALTDAQRDVERDTAELQVVREQIAEAGDALDALTEQAPDETELAALITRFDRSAYAVAINSIAGAQRRKSRALAAIAIKGRSFDVPPVVALSAAEASALVDTLTTQEQAYEAETTRHETLVADDASAAARMATITDRAGIDTDATMYEAITARDALWSDHRAALSTDTADRFEVSLRNVDGMAARRVQQGRDLGELRSIEADRAEHAARLKQSEATLDRLRHAAAKTRATLETVDVEAPLTQSGLVAWLKRVELTHTEHAALTDAQTAAALILRKADTLRATLTRLLPDAAATDDLDDLLAIAETRVDAAKTHATAIAEAKARRDTLQRGEPRRTRALEQTQTRLDEAETAWSALVGDLTGNAIAPTILLASLDPLRALREADDKRREMGDRIQKMQGEQARFRDATTALATKYGINPPDDPLDTFADLTAIVDSAAKAEDHWLKTNETLDAKLLALEETDLALADITRQIKDLGASFDPSIPTDTIEALRDSVRTAQEVIDARAQEQIILTRIGVDDLDAARAALDGKLADDIAAERAALSTDIALADDHYRTAIETRTQAENNLRTVTGDADVATLVEQRKTLELQLQEVALTYLELRLGQDLADEAMRRYRDANRGAMIEATERAFSDLTNGAYQQLLTQPDGQSETLLAIDANGATKPAAAMSKGTRFQLFLALRAAAYEQMASTGAVLPFFCDDIFETFDEDRTRAACTLMARIGQTGQAIYLTHHRHVVDIARETCGDTVTVHNIA